MRVFLPLLFILPLAATPLRVDLNAFNRNNAADPNFERWDISGGPTLSRSFGDITVTFTVLEPSGSALGFTWYKMNAESATLDAKMISDGLRVDGATSGAAIEMRISGLSAGPHTLSTYHNQCDAPNAGPFSPIHLDLDGERRVSSLKPSNRLDANSAAPMAYLPFEVTAGTDVVVTFSADVSQPSDMVKNVVINGFEIDYPNSSRQAQQPQPSHRNLHVDADDGTVTLQWLPASTGTVVAHEIYFGTDAGEVTDADPSSPAFRGLQTALEYPLSGLDSRQTYYWRVDQVDDLGNRMPGQVWSFRPRHLAFPGAEGYGRHAIGGREGRVVIVNSLDDQPGDPQPGTLRHAIERIAGPRTILFEVSGMITLQARLTLNDDQVTVAGQTAPGKGICIRGHTFGLSGAEDAIVRHLRVRPGNLSAVTIDGMGLSGCDHCILDHCSISWSIDEAFSSRSARHITLQRTLISEALNIAGHQEYPAGTMHGYAASIGGDIGSFHHNLLAHCYGRNWSLAGGLDANGSFAGRLDIRNNVVYNWGHRTTDGGAMEVNFVANYYKPGSSSDYFKALNAQYDNFPGMQRYYFAENVMPGHFGTANQESGWTETASNGSTLPSYENFVSSEFFSSHVNTQSAVGAYKQVLSDVGCNRPVLDEHDHRVISETESGTTTFVGSISGLAGIPDSQADVGGWEDYPAILRPPGWDSDRDGLPNEWEILHGTSPFSPPGDFSDAHADVDGDGYTALEDYLHWCACLQARCLTDDSLIIDLSSSFRGYTQSPVLTVTAPMGCSVAVESDLRARVTPLAGFQGIASFQATVTDAAGDSMTLPVMIHVAESFATPPLSLTLRASGELLELLATIPSGTTGVIERSQDLIEWSDVSTYEGNDATRILPISPPSTPQSTFYRLRSDP